MLIYVPKATAAHVVAWPTTARGRWSLDAQTLGRSRACQTPPPLVRRRVLRLRRVLIFVHTAPTVFATWSEVVEATVEWQSEKQCIICPVQRVRRTHARAQYPTCTHERSRSHTNKLIRGVQWCVRTCVCVPISVRLITHEKTSVAN